MGKGEGLVPTDGKSAGPGVVLGSGGRPRTAHERKDEQDEENEEAHSGDRRGGTGDDPEAERARDEGNDQEEDGVAQHRSRSLSRFGSARHSDESNHARRRAADDQPD